MPTQTLVKLGGSLLDLPDLMPRLLSILPSHCVILVGGGATADLVRQWDTRFGLSDDEAHQLAIEAMSLNARAVQVLHPEFCLVDRIDMTDNATVSRRNILAPTNVLADLEERFDRLPRSWDVTSDSIAAWIAARCNFSNLMLVKSVELPRFDQSATRSEQLTALQTSGLVDPQFTRFAAHVETISWCNLRSEHRSILQI